MAGADEAQHDSSGVKVSALTVVVPLFDEAANVPALAEALAAFSSAERAVRPVEIVLVDDGSRDATPDLLYAHAPRIPARVLTHAANRGLTAALRTGTEAAAGDLVGWLDGDLTYPPAILSQLAAACDAGADVATASCYHPEGAVEGVPPWRLWLSKAASLGHRLASGARLHTFTCMVRVQRREVVDRCRASRGGFVGVTETLLRALRAGYRVVEVPATLRVRHGGQSKMRVIRVGLAHLRLMAANLTGRLIAERCQAPLRH
jgi:dolichol-phosphate mannosyltransferase